MKCPNSEFFKLSSQILKQGSGFTFTALGQSMYPLIKNGDVLEVEPLGREKIKSGDIVFYRDDDNAVFVHRLVKKYTRDCRQIAVIQADGALSGAFEEILVKDILGRVKAIRRNNTIIYLDSFRGKMINRVNLILSLGIKTIRPLISRLLRSLYVFTRRALLRLPDKNIFEDKLIDLCIYPGIESSDKAQLELLLKKTLDWEYIFNKTKSEGLACVLYANLKSGLLGQVPEKTAEQFKREFTVICAKNIIFIEQFKKISAAFNAAGIKLVLLKGLFLAGRVYENISIRPMSDIDILIKKDDLSAANEALNSLGYHAPLDYKDFLPENKKASMNALMYRGRNVNMPDVHLHWHLINSTWPLERWVDAVDMRRVWENTEKVNMEGVDFYCLCPEHFLIYLCMHAFTHSFDRLVLLFDILAVLQYYEDNLNWDLIISYAREFKFLRIFLIVLEFIQKRTGRSIKGYSVIKQNKKEFQQNGFEQFSGYDLRRYETCYFLYLFEHPGFLEKARFISRTVFPEKEVIAAGLMLEKRKVNWTHYLRRVLNF
ncbi:MAG: nucleotidyltransferase family protein [Candidatus Omnitrophica bacterium]|nr:nucleotidyltransferase family protein [Candidatus Omnitrophota bacterium]